MKLYEIPRESKIYGKLDDGSEYLIFHYIDGMYSSCTTEKGGITQIHVMEDLIEFKDGYRI